jgi:hypothetical protein
MSDRTIPLPFEHQGLPHTRLNSTATAENLVMWITFRLVHFDRCQDATGEPKGLVGQQPRRHSSRGSITLSQLRTGQPVNPAPEHCPQRFLSSPRAKGLADLFIVAALRGSSRRSLGPRAVSNSETLAVHRICPAPTHLVAHFLATLFAPGLAKRPTNFAAHAPSRIQ